MFFEQYSQTSQNTLALRFRALLMENGTHRVELARGVLRERSNRVSSVEDTPSSATESAKILAEPTPPALTTSTASASPTATATATALPKSGGPSLVGPITLAASLALMASGVGALALLRRSVS
jgi:hypothetical protein